MPGGQGCRLVQEEKLGVQTGTHHLAVSFAEFEDADEPPSPGPVAALEALVRRVKAATPVAHPSTALSHRDKLAERSHAILQRHRALRSGTGPDTLLEAFLLRVARPTRQRRPMFVRCLLPLV